MTGQGRHRWNRVVAAGRPGATAAETMGGEIASLERAMPRDRLGRVGRAGRLEAAGADEEVGERQLVKTDRPPQQQRGQEQGKHEARKLAIRRGRCKTCGEGHGVATASAFSRFSASTSSWRMTAKSRPRA